MVIILTKMDKCNQSERIKNVAKIKQDLENFDIKRLFKIPVMKTWYRQNRNI